MIPYFQFETLQIGPITLQVWGMLVALGILIGAWTSARFAEKRGEKREFIYNVAFWIILGSFVGARFFHVFIYEPNFYLNNPHEILKIWHGGFSVLGGFVGALVAYLIYAKLNKFNWIEKTNVIIYGLPLGLGCGRIGCFLIHDHPGTLTDFALGVQQPGGGARHDHGLYLSINGFILAFVFYLLSKKDRWPGFFLQVFMIWYGIVRFFLDFWRIIDSRYFGLTPAQYGSVLMVVIGIFWFLNSWHSNRVIQLVDEAES